MKTVVSLLREYLSIHKGQLLFTFLVSMVASITAILLPLSIGKYYVLVFGFTGSKAILLDFLPDFLFNSVPNFMWFFSCLIVLKLISSYLQRFGIAALGEKMVHQIRTALFEHQLSLDMRVYDEKGIGKYLLRYSGDLKSVRNYITKGLIGFTVDICLLILCLTAIAFINKQLALISLISIPLIVLSIHFLNIQLNMVSEIRRNKRSNMLSFVNKRLIGIATVKAFNRHKPEMQKFQRRSQQLLLKGIRFQQLSTLVFVLIPAMLYGMIAVIMYNIHQLKVSGVVFDEGAILAAFLLILSMLPVFRRIFRVTVVWKLGMISLKKLVAIFNLPSNYSQSKDDLIMDKSSIVLENLSFKHGKQEVFNNLSLQWEGNGIHLIRGNMGSGKSSLINLLLGIHYPDSGKLLIDGQNAADVNEKSWRKQISVISTAFPLLGRTVFEAISYSRKESKRKHAERILNKMQSFLPEKDRMQLDDPIGHGGNGLSAGQEIILQFSRALLTNKSILLLDEPFQPMDQQMKAHFEKILQKLGDKRMILLFSKKSENDSLTYSSKIQLNKERKQLMKLKQAV